MRQQLKKYPKPVAARLSDDLSKRIAAVVAAIRKRDGWKIKKSNILEICVAKHLPVLEKECGIIPNDQS